MKRILAVDDHAPSRKLVVDLLESAGYEVLATNSAEQAIELALHHELDLVIMDIQLPGLDGVSAAQLLREHPRTQSTPILAVTAHAMRGDREHILDSGFDGYLDKPISYKALLNEVSRLTCSEHDESPEPSPGGG